MIPMRSHPAAPTLAASLLVAALLSAGAASPARASELEGAAILEHPCGRTAVQHMDLVHANKIEEAKKLLSPEVLAEWNALPEEDRAMMTEMMVALSMTGGEFAAEIREHGKLTVDGASAKLVVAKETAGPDGTSTETHTYSFAVDGERCLVAR